MCPKSKIKGVYSFPMDNIDTQNQLKRVLDTALW